MDTVYKTVIWPQFGAAIDMLDNAMRECPEAVWSDRARNPEFWYVAYHTLFWLDFYLNDSPEGFAPPAPFDLAELDPAGLLPPRVYTQDELRNYLQFCREKCRKTMDSLTDEKAREEHVFGKANFTRLELHVYNLRHVQHHAGQLHLLLRQTIDSAPRWVRRGA
jgi:hypothetical protein